MKRIREGIRRASQSVERSIRHVVHKEEEKEELEPEEAARHVLYGWTTHCLSPWTLPAPNNLTTAFAPFPLIVFFSFLYLTLTEKMRRKMEDFFDINEDSIAALKEVSPSLRGMDEPFCLLFSRLYIDETSKETIDPDLLNTLQDLFGPKVLVSIAHSNLRENAKKNTRGLADFVVSSKHGLVGVASGRMVAKWDGEARLYPCRPFSVSYQVKQMQSYIELTAPTRVAYRDDYEAWWVDLDCPSTEMSSAVVFLRPLFIGSILQFREKLDGKELIETMNMLKEQKPITSRLLLPRFQIHSRGEILTKWRLAGIFPEDVRPREANAKESIAPQLSQLFHATSLTVDANGIEFAPKLDMPNYILPHNFSMIDDVMNLKEGNPNFHCRFDSPFVCVVVHIPTLAPIMVGCYAGNPSPSMQSYRRHDYVDRRSSSRKRRRAVYRRPSFTRRLSLSSLTRSRSKERSPKAARVNQRKSHSVFHTRRRDSSSSSISSSIKATGSRAKSLFGFGRRKSEPDYTSKKK